MSRHWRERAQTRIGAPRTSMRAALRSGLWAFAGSRERLRPGGVGVEQRPVALTLRMPSAARASAMRQEACGALRAIVSDRPEAVRVAAWAEVAETLKTFKTATGFSAPAEVVVAA